jgi:hypothetical protein
VARLVRLRLRRHRRHGVHNFDPGFFVLKLGLPETVKTWCDKPADLAYPTSPMFG